MTFTEHAGAFMASMPTSVRHATRAPPRRSAEPLGVLPPSLTADPGHARTSDRGGPSLAIRSAFDSLTLRRYYTRRSSFFFFTSCGCRSKFEDGTRGPIELTIAELPKSGTPIVRASYVYAHPSHYDPPTVEVHGGATALHVLVAGRRWLVFDTTKF